MELNKIYHGDCLEVLRNFKDNSVDHVITSPPYNFGGAKYKEYTDNKTTEEYFIFIKDTLNQLLRITKYNIFFNIQMISGNKVALMKIMGEFADKIKDILIWDKMTAEPAIQKNVVNSQFEFIICLSDESSRMFRGGRSFGERYLML